MAAFCSASESASPVIRLTAGPAGKPQGDLSVLAGASCAFGVFDGVHEGHRFLIGRAVRRAHEHGRRAIALTFDIDPDQLFRAESHVKLMTDEDRLEMLSRSGVDAVVVLPFTREFAGLEPEAFLDALFGKYCPASVHVGYDFRFGCRAKGSVGTLNAWAVDRGMVVDACDLLKGDGETVTATRIRGLLAQGDIAQANELLGRPWRVAGTVERGRREGTDMGFATANLSIPANLRALGDGVYAARAYVGETQAYRAAVSMGVAPTFENAQANCEAHLLDFEGDLYGREVTLEFLAYLRPMMKFDSLEELISTVMGNIQWVRDNVEL